MNQSKKVAYYGIYAAVSVLMGYVEQLVPMPIPVPGIKLGLANIIVLLVLYHMGEREALGISLLRILLSGLLFSGFAGFLYSLAGAVFSYTSMVLLKKCKGFSILGVSVAGGICHNMGQLLMAAFVVNNVRLFYYFPVLLAAGIVTGMIVGVSARYCLVYLEKQKG